MYTRKSICAIYLLLARRWVAWEGGLVKMARAQEPGMASRRHVLSRRVAGASRSRLYHT